MSVQAIILAGGEGSGLRPLTKNRPNVLLPVVNRPIIWHLLDAVIDAGIRDITVVVCYHKELVIKAIGDYEIPVETAVQKQQLGPYDAIRAASSKIHADQILILSGDNYLDSTSLKALLQEKNAILAAPSSIPQEYSVIQQEGGYLTRLAKNQEDALKGSQVSCGAYILERNNLETILANDGFETTPNLKSLKISVVEAHKWEDAATPSSLLSLNMHLLGKHHSEIYGKIDKSAIIRGHVSVGNSTKIGPNTVIIGPVTIGENTIIEGNVFIGPGTSIGSCVLIEPFTFLKNSIIMNDVFIGAQSRIVDSIIGDGVLIEHAVTATKDGIGAVIGDRAVIGAFTQLKGIAIGNNAIVEGSKVLAGDDVLDNMRVM